MLRRSHSFVAIRPVVSIALAILLFAASVPPAVAASLAKEAAARSWVAFQGASSRATGWLGVFKGKGPGKKGTQQGPTTSTGVKPQPPPTKSQREARVSSLRINPKGDTTLQAGQPMLFSAMPLDNQGEPIQGLASEWETSDKEVVSITKTGDAVAGKPGHANLTATAGKVTQTTQVTVTEATKDGFGGKKQSSTRRKADDKKSFNQQSSPNSLAATDRVDQRRHHAGSAPPPVSAPTRIPTDDPLPDDESNSLYAASNGVGSPPGTKKPGAVSPPVVAQGTENGNQNFSFALPIVGLSGRGPGVSLSLVYNSQVWNKSTASDSSTWMSYDVDSGWPGPGFRLGFGQIEDQGDFGYTLTDPDGTRHALVYSGGYSYSSGYDYDTTDGTFIHYHHSSTVHALYYADGTVVTYGASGGGLRQYPTRITDRNGNYITIAYAGTSGAGPQIDYIYDTLHRYVNFYYDSSSGDLVTIKTPGLTGDLQVMRFYYDNVTIPSSGLFGSGVNVSDDTPSTVHTLNYVYLPTSSDGGSPQYTGYKFEYSAYGMIYQTTQSRGMTVSSTSTSSAGTVSSDGTQAAQTIYRYDITGASLTGVPTYDRRTDEWAGRTTSGSAPYYSFTNDQSTGISTVTAPDGTITETHAIVHSGYYDDGLISDTYVKDSSTTYTRTHMDWEQDDASKNTRVHQVLSTDSLAGLTKATVLSYTTFNNVSVVSERDFSTDGSVSDTKLRKTETTYVTSSNYLNHYLLHLPATVKIEPDGSSTPVAQVDYAYDDYGSSHGDMTSRGDIIMHDGAFDPFGGSYVSSTDYRGNVTSVTTYTSAPGGTGAITHSTKYDIAGNVTSAQVDCCQSKSFTYSGAGTSGDYAYPASVTSGNPSGVHTITYAEFDYDTGLPATATDENGQTTTNFYNADSLRLEHVTSPGGGATYVTYSDSLSADANGKYHSYVETSAKLDGSGGSTRYVISRQYFDGRGAVARTMSNHTSADGWSTQDIEYNEMGRAYRASNPYFATDDTAAINSAGYWTTSTFDHLGRVTVVTMPTGDNSTSSTTTVSTSFDGIYTTVTDQAGKTRRQKVDAIGRVIRLDEPTTSGLGSTSSPNQATSYEYDLLDNLVHITQGSQDRYFKYDSLSRLIREKQVEQETNSSYNLSDAWNSSSAWTRKIDYNSSGLVTDAYDARGVHTTFSYDDLNRVTQISYSDSTPTAHYYYDGNLPSGAPSYTASNTAGRLTAMTYGSGTPVTGNYFAYDVMGRVVTQKQVTGSTTFGLSYTYNYAGLLTTENYPSTRAMTYAYDEGGRLATVGDGTTTFAGSFSYAAHGGLASETFGNQMVHALEYNRRLQANKVKLSQTVSSTTTVLQQYDYGYGAFNTSTGDIDTSKNNGQIGKITSSLNGDAKWNQGFTYDELGRLSNMAEHPGTGMGTASFSQGYTYDKYGNRKQSLNTPLGLPDITDSDYDSTPNNRFKSTGDARTTYDAVGNITEDRRFRSLKYEYDANGRQSAVKQLDDTGVQTSVYDCAGQRVQTTEGGTVRTMIYDVFGQNIADYLGSSGSTLERENIYRGGQLLATAETPVATAPSGTTAARASSSSITVSWSAASGASYYRVERKAAGIPYALVSTVSSSTTSLTDSSRGTNTAYLYRVCSADSSGSCVSNYSNVALGTTVSFSTDPTIYSYTDSPSSATVVKAAHITELRTAVNAVRSLAGQSGGGWTHTGLAAGDYIYAADVNDLRSELHAALLALGLYDATYADPTLATGASGTLIKKAHIVELRQHATGSSSNSKSISDFVTALYSGSLHGSHPTSGELSSGISTLSAAQAQGPAALLSAAQTLGSTIFNSSDYTGLSTSNAQFVSDLYTGFLQRSPDDSGYAYWQGVLAGSTRASLINEFATCEEFRTAVAALGLAGTSESLHYVLTDIQGSTRAVMNSNGSSSAVIARHDYLPFGEELGSGTGSRTGGQGYGASDTNRWKYGMLQRDAATGLDHAGWRKYESFSGRWTSPDPQGGSIGDPQSFNHYTYAANDPVNFVDPGGLSEHPIPKLDPTPTPTWHVNALPDGWDDMTGILPDWTSDNLSMLLGQFLMLQGPANVVSNSIVEAKKLLAKDKCRDFVQNVLGVSNPDGLIPLIEKAVLTSHPDGYNSDGKGVHAVATWDNQGNYSIDFYKPFFTEQLPKLDSGRFVLSGPVPMEERPRDPKAQGQDTLHEGIHLWTGKTDIQLASLFQKPGEKPFTDKLKASEFWNQKLKEKCK